MKTPIVDFVKGYIEADVSRLHMPGHKGRSYVGCEALDITEISGADVLYFSEGIIKESEENASSLFGTARTFYSTEGSSLVIKAMLALVAKKNGYILAARNVHKSFVYAAALIDVDVKWIYPESFSSLCSCIVSAEDIREQLTSVEQLPCAVYLTSPDYLGNMLDIRAIASVCDEFGVPLLVDNAHGAYLAFCEQNLHPISLGASMCCDSAHKTLPALTGGAYLHISKKAPTEYVEKASSKLALFASTSPSYLVLQSLDMCNKILSDNYFEEIKNCVSKIEKLKKELIKAGFNVNGNEPLKLSIDTRNFGYKGTEIACLLREVGVELEYSDEDSIVAMITPDNRDDDIERLRVFLLGLSKKESLAIDILTPSKPKKMISIREAIFSDSEFISVEEADGRICASPTVSCPPAVPVVISGEEIGEAEIEIFKKYRIERVEVVK